MRGHALRYLWWQIVDRTGPRILAAVAVSGGFLGILYMAMREDKPSPAIAENVLGQLHYQLVFMFILLLLNGVVSQDRIQGWYRFYLAKPVSPSWFYGQHAVLALLGLLAASAVFITLGSLLIQPIWNWHHMGPAVAAFLLYGMMMFLWSTLVKHDWLVGGLLLIGSAVAKSRWKPGTGALGDLLHRVLPPTHLLGWNRDLTAAQWAWVAGWGVGLLILALLVLRFRPLGED